MKFKKYSFFTIISVSLCSFIFLTAKSPLSTILFIGKREVAVTDLQERFKQERPAIYVDFHKVIANSLGKQGFKNFKKKHLTSKKSKLKFAGRIIKTALNPIVWGKMAKLKLKKTPITENYFNVVKKHGSKKLYKHLIQLATELYEPNLEMINLLYQLKATGCRIHLFSNGGYDTIQELKIDPRFKHYFEGPNPLFTENSINDTPSSKYNYGKPSAQAYEKALAKHKESAHLAVFFDDTRENLCDWRNTVLTKAHPQFSNFWACSLLYDHKNHAAFADILTQLNILV